MATWLISDTAFKQFRNKVTPSIHEAFVSPLHGFCAGTPVEITITMSCRKADRFTLYADAALWHCTVHCFFSLDHWSYRDNPKHFTIRSHTTCDQTAEYMFLLNTQLYSREQTNEIVQESTLLTRCRGPTYCGTIGKRRDGFWPCLISSKCDCAFGLKKPGFDVIVLLHELKQRPLRIFLFKIFFFTMLYDGSSVFL